MQIHQQHHGYLRGHQLLASSVKLERSDQEVIDRLSDIAGSSQGAVELPPYLTGYPLPSRRFFVFARTWYDRDAARAGCVLTHSLLVPSQQWAAMRRPSSLRELHQRFRHADRSPIDAISFEQEMPQPLEVERENVSSELIEALFLEKQEPVLWIAENPQLAILRIVDALWPSIRSTFAFQTYSLKPRSIEDRPFDLMAAPRIARGRFANWPGRRVEGLGLPRHAWTIQLSNEIFEANEPDLARVDPLGILQSDVKGDPARLRLSLLWNDLEAQALQSPSAALGMLDILAASSLPSERIAQLLVPIARRAIVDEAWKQFPSGAGRFLALLLEKLGGLPTPVSLDATLTRAASELISTQPREGLRLLTDWTPSSDRLEALVDRALFEAANRGRSPAISGMLEHLPDDRLLRLLEHQPALAAVALAGATDPDALATLLGNVFPSLSPRSQDTIRKQVPRRLTKESARLIGDLADGLDAADLCPLVMSVLSLPRRDRLAVSRELLKASKERGRLMIVREATYRAPISPNEKAELIGETFSATLEDLDWLLALDDRDLAIEILRQYKWPANGVIGHLLGPPDVQRLIGLLLDAGQEGTALAVLHNARIPIEKKLDTFEPLLERLPAEDVERVIREWLSVIFPVSTKGEALLGRRILSLVPAAGALRGLTPRQLAETLLSNHRLDKRTARWTLDVLMSAPEAVTSCIAKAVDGIVERLIQGSDFDKAIFSDWARLIELSLPFDTKSSVIAARDSLEFTLRRPRQPVSELVKSAFLIVYPLAKQDIRPIYTGFFSTPIDRPTKMRRDLADAYLDARWPRRDLAIIAVKLGITEKVFSYLQDRWGGPRYLREMYDDLDPRGSVDEKQARKFLRPFV